jgi:hypothetical protein
MVGQAWEAIMVWKLVMAALVLVPGVAQAEWQYTRWGMTPHEVLRASNGAARLVTEIRPRPGVEYPGLKGSHSTTSTEFETRFFFSGNQLDRITLRPLAASEETVELMERRLRQKYGSPLELVAEERARTLVWIDEERRNRIALRVEDKARGRAAAVTYSAL